jgi:hypothetical protein
MKNKFSNSIKIPKFLYFVLLHFLSSCAVQSPPGGGPPDKTPPIVIRTFPELNSTKIPINTKVEIEFNERMNKKSVENSIFVSPLPPDELKFKWFAGKRVQIIFPDSLEKEKTYVINIGTNAEDVFQNKMQNSFTLAFSTGDSLDKGKISGTVYNDKNEPQSGAFIWGYELSVSERKNEINPAQDKPKYITQCGTDGTYNLNYISPNIYRIFAIVDKDNNQLYDEGYDQIGISSKDIDIRQNEGGSPLAIKTDLSFSGNNIRIFTADTLKPSIVSVVVIDKNHLYAKFSEGIDLKTVKIKNNYLIIDSSDVQSKVATLKILSVYRDFKDFSKIHIVTSSQKDSAEYILKVNGLMDFSENIVDEKANSLSFIGSSTPDTIKPKLIFKSPPDSSKNIMPFEPIKLIFSEAMDTTSVEKHFTVSEKNGSKVKGNFEWLSKAELNFTPNNGYKSVTTYSVKLHSDSVTDINGNKLSDSLITFIFTSIDKDTVGSITGAVYDEKENANGKIYITATKLDESKNKTEISINFPGNYIIDNLLPGLYKLSAYRDEDKNDKYTSGKAFPFLPSERFVINQDSVNVRSDWEQEGKDLRFKK